MLRGVLRFLLGACLTAFVAGSAWAENEGQADLDKATQLKVTAETLDDLNEVIDHAETAIEKGLDADNKKFAEQLLVASLMQRGQMFAAAVFNVPATEPQRGLRSMQFRQFALSDLQRAVTLDENNAEAQMWIGKLQSLPYGDKTAARRALSKVIGNKDAADSEKAEAYALRSAVQKDEKDKRADLDKAIELVPNKMEYLELRAAYLYEQQKFEEALADVRRVLESEPDNADMVKRQGMILLEMNKYDEALQSFDRLGELSTDEGTALQLRGELFRQKGDLEKAVEELTKALEKSPGSVGALLLRAATYFELKENDKALADVEKAIELEPTAAQPHLMKIEILTATNQLDKAIEYLEKLNRTAPGNVILLTRLGTLYLVAERPRQTIEIASRILAQDPTNLDGLRLRADAYLNVGDHANAITDFEKVLAQDEDDQNVLNNFAWVLATSPDDELRDGTRAVKLATQAAERTGYEIPHVLSTLAAAYAETGDFENAEKWSQKAVELAQKEVESSKTEDNKAKLEADRDQLQKELENYRMRKPVRERQSIGEEPKEPETTNRAGKPEEEAAGTDGESRL